MRPQGEALAGARRAEQHQPGGVAAEGDVEGEAMAAALQGLLDRDVPAHAAAHDRPGMRAGASRPASSRMATQVTEVSSTRPLASSSWPACTAS